MIRILLRLALLAALAVAGWMAYFVTTPLTLPQTPYEFTLKHGSSLRSVARQLVEAKILSEPWSFTALVRMQGKEGEIKAGNYYLENDPTPLQLFRMITRGDVSQSEIAFIEGWNFRRMRQTLDEHQAVRHDTAQMTEREILEKIGAQEEAAEGLFFPDTYYFSSGMSDLSILKRAYQAMQTHLADAWAERDPLLPYQTPYEALIMASIVEKETGRANERPHDRRRIHQPPAHQHAPADRSDGDLWPGRELRRQSAPCRPHPRYAL